MKDKETVYRDLDYEHEKAGVFTFKEISKASNNFIKELTLLTLIISKNEK